ncbi:hypothetical protein FACS1894110_26360 [Spirochaetia bacterium]|nr:hypothetical protein FACS1894110_26360 [Spirochaetia bacterium]
MEYFLEKMNKELNEFVKPLHEMVEIDHMDVRRRWKDMALEVINSGFRRTIEKPQNMLLKEILH